MKAALRRKEQPMSSESWRRVFQDTGWTDPEKRRSRADVQIELSGGHLESLHYMKEVHEDYFVIEYRDGNRAYYLWSSILRITEKKPSRDAIIHEHER
jgi:hypothetical protein